MKRITKSILENQVKNLNGKVSATSENAYVLEGSYGKQQLYQVAMDSLGSYTARQRISPLLSKSDLHTWLWAFSDGIDVGSQLPCAKEV